MDPADPRCNFDNRQRWRPRDCAKDHVREVLPSSCRSTEAFSEFECRLCPTCYADIELTQRSQPGPSHRRIGEPVLIGPHRAARHAVILIGGDVDTAADGQCSCSTLKRRRHARPFCGIGPFARWLKLSVGWRSRHHLCSVPWFITSDSIEPMSESRLVHASNCPVPVTRSCGRSSGWIRRSKRVPEEGDPVHASPPSFLYAVDLLNDGKSAEAMPLLLACQKTAYGRSPLAGDLPLKA